MPSPRLKSMCGIVGYVGPQQSLSVLLAGLGRLEYRGYDSAGVAVISADNTLHTAKKSWENLASFALCWRHNRLVTATPESPTLGGQLTGHPLT